MRNLWGTGIPGIIGYRDEFSIYLTYDYKVYYVLDPERAADALLIKNRMKRFYVVTLLTILNIFYCYKMNYTVTINYLNLDISSLLYILFIIL